MEEVNRTTPAPPTTVSFAKFRYDKNLGHMTTKKVTKRPLSLVENKRYYINALKSVAYGHKLSMPPYGEYEIGHVRCVKGGYIKGTERFLPYKNLQGTIQQNDAINEENNDIDEDNDIDSNYDDDDRMLERLLSIMSEDENEDENESIGTEDCEEICDEPRPKRQRLIDTDMTVAERQIFENTDEDGDCFVSA